MKPAPNPNDDPLKNIRELWPRLHPWQRKSLVIRAFFYSLPARLQNLHPSHVVIPATLAQAAVFIIALLHPSQSIFILAVGNISIVALAMLPSLAHAKIKN